MIWKPKEKELTEEESIAIAKKELAPFWIGSTPLLVGLEGPKGFVAVPLDREFPKKSWLIFFVDPTDFSGETTLIFAKEWYKRYSFLELEILAVFCQSYQFFDDPRAVQQLVDRFQVGFPLVLDHDGALGNAFKTDILPTALLLSQGKYFFRHVGRDWFDGTEIAIQDFLRSKDPGLSLLPVLNPDEKGEDLSLIVSDLSFSKISRDLSRIEFGFQPKIGQAASFPSPGFTWSKAASDWLEGSEHPLDPLAKYRTKRHTPAEEKSEQPSLKSGSFELPRGQQIAEGEFIIEGQWIQDSEKIMTRDPNAILRFCSPGARVSLVAQSLTKGETSMISVDFEGESVFDSIVGEHLSLEETGEALLRVSRPQLYHALVGLPKKYRTITLRFLNAETVQVGIYGLRFGD